MRYDTGNPVGADGSSSPFDLYDNAGVIDLLLNGSMGEYLNRLGVPLRSWQGILQQVNDYLIAQGYESTYLVYGAGVVVQRQTQLVQRSGDLYRVLNASDLPLTLTGTWATDAPKLLAVGDAALRQALAATTGTTLVTHLAQPLDQKLREIPSIRDYGGGEEKSDNYAALNAAKAAVGAGGMLRLPKLSTGDYLFVGGPANLLDLVLVPDKGVRILTASSTGTFSSSIVTTEDLTIRVNSGASKDYDFVLRKNFYKGSKSGKKDLWIPDAIVRDTKPTAVLANSQLLYKQVQLGVSDTLSNFTPSQGVTADALTLLPPTGGNTQLGLYSLRPGEQITCGVNVLPDANGELAVGIVWSTGYAVLRGASSAGAWTMSTKYAGVAVVETTVVRPDGNGNTPGYFPAQNHFTVRFLEYNRAQILISGIVAVEILLTSGYLMHAGFGSTSVSAATLTSWVGWYRSRFAASTGSRAITLGFAGDSMTDDLQSAWPWAAARALDGSLGIRVAGIENRARSGDTTLNQLNYITSNPFVNASHVAIFLSTNDIQGNTTFSTWKAQYTALIDLIRGQGRQVALIIPPLWYTSIQSGVGGGAIRSEYGGNMRAAIGRLAADYGAPLVDLSNLSGVISAAFLGNSFTDPMLRDNLHESTYFNEIIGEAVARAWAGQIAQVPARFHAWVTLSSSIYSGNFTGTVQYRIHENGDIELRGTATLSTGTVSDGLTVFNLPAHLQTPANRKAQAFGSSTTAGYTGNCTIQADAAVKVYNMVGATTVNFDGVRYTA